MDLGLQAPSRPGEEDRGRIKARTGREKDAFGLTGVDKSPRGTFAELLGLVGQRDFHNSGDVPRGSLDPDGVRSYQLGGREGIRKDELFSNTQARRCDDGRIVPRSIRAWCQTQLVDHQRSCLL